MSKADEPTCGRRVLYVANTDWYLFNFRLNLFRQARAEGWDVVLACTSGAYARQLEAEGWDVEYLPFSSKEINPLRELASLFALVGIIRRRKPTVVHLFTLKCVLYGLLCGTVVGRNAQYIGALTGMGYLFTTRTYKTRAIKKLVLYGLAFGLKGTKAQLVFQNNFDRQELVDAHLLPAHRTHVIRGSGVDCERFSPVNRSTSPNGQLRLLYCGRLIAEKGIREYLTATAELRGKGYTFESRIAGAPYPGNPSSLSVNEVEHLKNDRNHIYLGHCDDMQSLLAHTDIVVLPTYREGTPKALLEAAASGCIIVTTDIPGCQGIVEPECSGYLVPPRRAEAIADAIERILSITAEQRRQMGERSRQIALRNFSDKQVNRCTLALYNGTGRIRA